MKRGNRILIGVGCVALLLVSWIVAVTAPTNAQKQLTLMERASAFMDDEVYIRAVPLLEEAAGYHTQNTLTAETMLKEVYLQLIEQQGYTSKYTGLLEKQMSRESCAPDIFIEAAHFYMERSKLANALAVLKSGIAKTGSEELAGLYEKNRYAYQLGHSAYEDVTAIHGMTVAVQIDGLWGLAQANGSLLIPCQYDKISTYSTDRAIVQKNSEIFAVDSAGNRLALLKENASDFGNYANDRIPLLIDGQWRRANGELLIGSAAFEQLGTYSGGFIAAKENGKWGVVDIATDWLLPPEYDEIIMDELGRSYAQDSVFVRKGDSVYLYVNGVQVGDSYENARPFGSEGYAAVMKNGKWGFINTSGELMIPYQFENALSFGQHLAAVMIGDSWGYVSLTGEVVIEPGFIQAKSFANGSAPVLTERGWQFITLLEYKEEAGL